MPIYGGAVQGELCTPTGAALLTHFAQSFGPMPVMSVKAVGVGIGTKQFEQANCVRAFLGETAEEANGEIVELVCNIDDMTPEALAFACARLLDLGALDVYTVPGTMKKGRPGHVLTVLCRREQEGEMARQVLAQTTTNGLRVRRCGKYFLTPGAGEAADPMGAGPCQMGAGLWRHPLQAGVRRCGKAGAGARRPLPAGADRRGPQPARRGGGNAMKRACKIVLSLLLVLAVLCGCQSGQQPDAPSGGQAAEDSVVIALDTNSEPEAGFDPAYGWGAGEHVHEPLIQSTLTVTDAGLNIGYDLATGYSVSDDGLTWTVTIRDDVSFTDGEPLTAEDVAFTYNTVKEASSVNDFTMLDYAEAVDDTTVLFHMTTPFSIWPYTMAIVGIVPEHAYDSATYGANPIGSGRYLLKQWDRGQQVILEANPDYYGEAPKMKRVTILFMEEDAAFLAAQAGQVDVAYTSATYSDQAVDGYTLASYRTVDNRGFNLPAVPAGTDANGRGGGQ